MTTYEDILKANATLKPIDVKGKQYAPVTERIKAFRMIHPEGGIMTEIVSIENGVCVIRATVTNADGSVLGTGTAYEKESSSFINKTSYIENCETSAVGRALGMAGYGIDGSMASAEELLNAVKQQEDIKKDADTTAQFGPEATKPDNANQIRQFAAAHGLTNSQMGNYFKAAVENNFLPKVKSADLNPEQLEAFFRFVSQNIGG